MSKKNLDDKSDDKSDDIWDYIIIGAGITGLYAAYRLRQNADPSTRILVLEAGCRIGGRMAMVDFHGVKVEPGAGIGRLEKDRALRGLLEELGIKWQEFPVTHNYSPAAYDAGLANNRIKGAKRFVRIGRAAQKVELPQPTPKLQTPDWIKKQVSKLRSAYKKNPAATTFHAFAQKVLGRAVYQQLVLALGYTDYEKEDVRETLYNYGLEDLYDHWTGMGIDWQELMDTLIEHSFADIKLNTRVVRLTRDEATSFFTIQTSYVPPQTSQVVVSTRTHKSSSRTQNTPKTRKHIQLGLTRQNIPNLATTNSIGCDSTKTKTKGARIHRANSTEFRARKVLIATSIGPAREIVSDFLIGEGLRVPVHLSGVHAQSFLRIYGYFTGENQKVMQKYVQHTQVVPGGYHRVIPMGSSDDGKSGVYMIVYTDNRAADDLEHLQTNIPANRKILATGIKMALGIPAETHLEIQEILSYYWREGTHYYTPLNHAKFGSRDEFLQKLQRPTGTQGGLFVAGEAFSRQQGWTEGALESVDTVLDDML
jgi:protoporphyrinogen oxidase